MNFSLLRFFTMSVLLLSLGTVFTSCNRNNELHAFDGYVYNINKIPVVDANVQIFKSPQDWLTGHNILVNMKTDRYGHFLSSPGYEAGEYFIFVEKYDTSNWNIRDVENGIYPMVSLPIDGDINQIIDYNNMALLANTRWKLTNTLVEYTQPGHTAVEWHSTWSSANNCLKDNEILFGKDLSFRVYEGNILCKNQARNILGTFVPPLIFSSKSCDNLLHTTQNVKEFEFSNWPEMEQKNASIYLTCDQTSAQIYLIFDSSITKKELWVYSRL